MTVVFSACICKYCHYLGISKSIWENNWYCRHLKKESAGIDVTGRVDHVTWQLFQKRHHKKELKS